MTRRQTSSMQRVGSEARGSAGSYIYGPHVLCSVGRQPPRTENNRPEQRTEAGDGEQFCMQPLNVVRQEGCSAQRCSPAWRVHSVPMWDSLTSIATHDPHMHKCDSSKLGARGTQCVCPDIQEHSCEQARRTRGCGWDKKRARGAAEATQDPDNTQYQPTNTNRLRQPGSSVRQSQGRNTVRDILQRRKRKQGHQLSPAAVMAASWSVPSHAHLYTVPPSLVAWFVQAHHTPTTTTTRPQPAVPHASWVGNRSWGRLLLELVSVQVAIH